MDDNHPADIGRLRRLAIATAASPNNAKTVRADDAGRLSVYRRRGRRHKLCPFPPFYLSWPTIDFMRALITPGPRPLVSVVVTIVSKDALY